MVKKKVKAFIANYARNGSIKAFIADCKKNHNKLIMVKKQHEDEVAIIY